MSVYLPKGTKVYQYDFQLKGVRFCASTGATSQREAKKVEDRARDVAERELALQVRRDNAPMTFTGACARYWTERGRFAKSADQIEKHLAYLIERLGPETPLAEITNSKIADLIAVRRGEFVDNPCARKSKKAKPAKRLSNATVNRSTLDPLKRVLLMARDVWGEQIAPIEWSKHRLAEPKERVRAMTADEEARFFEKLPIAYHDIARFAIRTGCRASECLNLRHDDIDFGTRTATIYGKGDTVMTVPLPLDICTILLALKPGPDGRVFLMPERSSKNGNLRAPARPMSYRAFYQAIKTACDRAKVPDFHPHDLRHTAATRLLRSKGNLKLAQRLLRHASITTTAKYAHVFDDELRAALDSMHEVPKNSRKDAANA